MLRLKQLLSINFMPSKPVILWRVSDKYHSLWLSWKYVVLPPKPFDTKTQGADYHHLSHGF